MEFNVSCDYMLEVTQLLSIVVFRELLGWIVMATKQGIQVWKMMFVEVMKCGLLIIAVVFAFLCHTCMQGEPLLMVSLLETRFFATLEDKRLLKHIICLFIRQSAQLSISVALLVFNVLLKQINCYVCARAQIVDQRALIHINRRWTKVWDKLVDCVTFFLN